LFSILLTRICFIHLLPSMPSFTVFDSEF
jgi:hypothetical protein